MCSKLDQFMCYSVGTNEVTPSLVTTCTRLPLAGLLFLSVVHSNSFLKKQMSKVFTEQILNNILLTQRIMKRDRAATGHMPR